MNYIETITTMSIEYAPKVLGAILTLVVGFWITSRVTRIVRKGMEKREVDQTLVPFISSLVSVSLKILVVLSAGSMFGLEITAFVAIFSALAFAIGMALQGNLGHMAAGILILFFKPYKVGDFIVTQGYSGTVSEVQIFNTVLTTLDNRIIILPNGTVTSGPIENLTTNEKRKVPLTFSIGYREDIDNAREVLKKVADSCPYIDHDQNVDIFVSELAGSSVNFAVRPWCKTENYWDVYFYMQENVKKEFDRAGVSIPFPQMDVHLEKMN